MTLDHKTLEAALKAAAKVYASQDRREPPTPSDIEGTAEDLRSPINAFLALADLVPHSDVQAALDYLTAQKNLTAEMMRERDEALSLAETQGRQLAALREAILKYMGNEFTYSNLNAVLLTTAAAAARYRLVDDEHVVVRSDELNTAMEFIFREFTDRLHPAKFPDWLNNLVLATAPAAEGEAGEGTEPEEDDAES